MLPGEFIMANMMVILISVCAAFAVLRDYHVCILDVS